MSELPADPEATAAIAKVKRLMLLVSAATLIALAVVLGIIGYRVFNAGGSASPVADRILPLPPGAKVQSSTISEGRIVVTIEIGGAAEILSFDQKTLKPQGRIRLAPQ